MSERPQNKHLKPCKPGETHNPNGRPKKIITRLSEQIGMEFGIELSKADMYQLIQWALERNEPELTQITENAENPMFLINIAECLINDKKNKRLTTVETIFDRVFGKPKQATELTGKDGGPIQTESKQIIKFGDKEIEF